jgi:hypothetical protein
VGWELGPPLGLGEEVLVPEPGPLAGFYGGRLGFNGTNEGLPARRRPESVVQKRGQGPGKLGQAVAVQGGKAVLPQVVLAEVDRDAIRTFSPTFLDAVDDGQVAVAHDAPGPPRQGAEELAPVTPTVPRAGLQPPQPPIAVPGWVAPGGKDDEELLGPLRLGVEVVELRRVQHDALGPGHLHPGLGNDPGELVQPLGDGLATLDARGPALAFAPWAPIAPTGLPGRFGVAGSRGDGHEGLGDLPDLVKATPLDYRAFEWLDLVIA